MGQTQHRFLEMSHVAIVEEMVNMIVAQRAYEFNSKSIQTSDNMLGIAANLKR
jgi:flagellar basal-body rod protein FlgG